MGEEADPPGATKENLGCSNPANIETAIEMEFDKTREEPQDVPSSALTSPSEALECQQTDNQGSEDPTAKERTPDSCLTDMDCPVCFSRYDLNRLPKELLCRHSFCAVCLKLLVHNEAGTWLITCPICRAPTAIFGGLVCTLQNQELLMSRVQNLEVQGTAPETSRLPEMAIRLDHRGVTWNSDVESSGTQWTAAKRMVVLLLMLLIVLIIILQFICTGIMKWMLGCALGVVVIITVLLCFNPYWKMRFLGARRQRKDDRSTSAS